MTRNKKNVKLVNIYLRIHNRQVLTMDDLAYLAKYNPVCFKLTCDKLINNVQETKTPTKIPEKTIVTRVLRSASAKPERRSLDLIAGDKPQNERLMEQVMESFKKIESVELSKVNALQNIDMSQVKELLGDLFTGSNSAPVYFNAAESGSRFNVSV